MHLATDFPSGGKANIVTEPLGCLAVQSPFALRPKLYTYPRAEREGIMDQLIPTALQPT
jgi:hypothetical protein